MKAVEKYFSLSFVRVSELARQALSARNRSRVGRVVCVPLRRDRETLTAARERHADGWMKSDQILFFFPCTKSVSCRKIGQLHHLRQLAIATRTIRHSLFVCQSAPCQKASGTSISKYAYEPFFCVYLVPEALMTFIYSLSAVGPVVLLPGAHCITVCCCPLIVSPCRKDKFAISAKILSCCASIS